MVSQRPRSHRCRVGITSATLNPPSFHFVSHRRGSNLIKRWIEKKGMSKYKLLRRLPTSRCSTPTIHCFKTFQNSSTPLFPLLPKTPFQLAGSSLPSLLLVACFLNSNFSCSQRQNKREKSETLAVCSERRH